MSIAAESDPMAELNDCILRILPVLRHYDWGKRAESSLVYRLFTHGSPVPHDPNSIDCRDKRFAELWLGDHDDAPCGVIPYRSREIPMKCCSSLQHSDGVVELSTLEEEHLPSDTSRIGGNLIPRLSSIYKLMRRQLLDPGINGPSILLKVLSIAKPLSLQIHPDQECAARMYREKHACIVDSQAKPEMCLALCQFRFMCGLRPLSEIVSYAEQYTAFSRLIGDALLTRLRTSSPETDGNTYISLGRRLLMEDHDPNIVDELVAMVNSREIRDLSEQILLTLHDMHGNDICVTFAFILNCVELQGGEACFIPPNTLHSYISGDCMELMNNSDNVIRCGLTTKATDTATVVQLLEVENSKGNRFPQTVHVVQPRVVSGFVKKYQPIHPVCNFALWSFVVPGNTHVSHLFTDGNQPFIGIVLDTNEHVKVDVDSTLNQLPDHHVGMKSLHHIAFDPGDALLLYPCTKLHVSNNGDTDFVMYFGTEVSSA